MRIENLKVKQVNNLALLHKAYIGSGFLSSLGLNFLRLLYSSMVGADSTFCLIAIENNKPIGFISGAIEVKAFYKEFLRKNFLLAGCIIAVKAFKPSVFRKVVETLFYPKKECGNLPEAELLSIVVEDTYQGKGVSTQLFRALVEEFKKRGIEKFKIVVGKELIAAQRFYEKMEAKLQKEIEVHKGEKSLLYVYEARI